MPERADLRGLRVLMTADAVGGVFSYVSTLAAELARRGATVCIAAIGPAPTAEQRRAVDGMSGVRLLSAPFALEWMDDPWDDVNHAGEWLSELERELRPDVVHLNGFVHAALPWAAPCVVVAHSCVLSWWRAVFGERAPERYDPYRARVAEGLNSADRVVAPTRAMLDCLRAEHGYAGPGEVVFNGVDSAQYVRGPKQPFLLAAGRQWDRAKNLELVLAAAPKLPWPVRIAGPRSLGDSQDGRREAVRYWGQLSRAALARVMSEAPIFVHPARYEPFGLAPLEAACSGAALVLGGIDSLREIWEEDALYVSPDDASELCAAVTRLIDDPVLRHRSAARAESRARSWSSGRMADAYSALYLELTSPRPAHESGAARAGAPA